MEYLFSLILLLILAVAAMVVARTLFVRSRQVFSCYPKAVEVNEDVLARRLADAIRINTSSQPGDQPPTLEARLEMISYLKRTFPMSFGKASLDSISEEGWFCCLVWKANAPSRKPVAFLSHFDVVPAPNADAWTHPPFSGDVSDGFVWGRGALDMKGFGIALLSAFEHTLTHNWDYSPSRDIYLILTFDEESGGENGAAKIAEILEKRGIHLAATFDEGLMIMHGMVPGVSRPVALVGLTEKQLAYVELSADGERGHSGMPPEWPASRIVSRAVERIGTHPMPASLGGVPSMMFEFLARDASFAYRAVFSNLWLFGPVLLRVLLKKRLMAATVRSTAVETEADDGVKRNVLPPTARRTLNVRVHPKDTLDQVLEWLRRAIDDPRVRLDVTFAPTGTASNPKPVISEAFLAIQAALADSYPDAIVAPGATPATTDSRHYAGITDESIRFQPVNAYPGDPERIHGLDERVAVHDLANMTRFFVRLIQRLS